MRAVRTASACGLAVTSLLAAAADPDPRVALGERLFSEMRFDSPLGDMDVGCTTCHARSDQVGYRGFADALGRSWHPWRNEDPGRETLRNAPGLFDLSGHSFIHTDGEFLSLEAQTEKTLTGRNFGWLPGELEQARRQVASILRMDYAAGFSEAYRVDIAKESDAACVHAAARAIADFMRSLTSERASPYDAFVRENSLDEGPRPGEGPAAYGTRILSEIDQREKTKTLARAPGFSDDALAGYRIFLQTKANERNGNCVVCHVPPTFTDENFHNTGVTQEEYDAIHGSGSFAKLDVPSAGTRPLDRFQKRARLDRAGETDLGYWNFARYENSPLYRPQEAESEFRVRTIATFKTPPLRNLPSTPPYMHNGAYTSLESTLQQKVEAAFLARMGDLRNADPDLSGIRIMEDDFKTLFAFLNALCDAGTRTAEFRESAVVDSRVAPSAYNYKPDELDLVGTEDDPALAAEDDAASNPDEIR